MALLGLGLFDRQVIEKSRRPATSALAEDHGAAVLLPWEARTVVLSGYLGYPTTFGPLAVDWRIPLPFVQHEQNWIQARARNPDVSPGAITLGGDWLPTWLQMLPDSITTPLQGSALLAVVALATLDLRRRPNQRRTLWLFLLLPLAGLTFWFFTAPAYRFAQASFWILMVGLAVLVAESVMALQEQHRALLVLIAVLLGLWMSLFSHPFITQRQYVLLPPNNDRVPPFSTLTADSGLSVHKPSENECWSIPIPCTDEFYRSLELRHPGDLSSGFRVHPGAVENWPVR